jgi:hypothetical protein
VFVGRTNRRGRVHSSLAIRADERSERCQREQVELVRACAVLQQRSGARRVALLDGFEEGGRFEDTLCLALRAVAEERHASRALALARGGVKCGAPTLVDHTDAGPGSAQ